MASSDVFLDGRRRLRQLLPWARAEARKTPFDGVQHSPLGRAQIQYARTANLDALIIYAAPLGGWHADVVFKSVPPGTPNT
ncbi:MAG: hypothetical protein ACRYGR_08630, partial [Janthinobacterium lividum]